MYLKMEGTENMLTCTNVKWGNFARVIAHVDMYISAITCLGLSLLFACMAGFGDVIKENAKLLYIRDLQSIVLEDQVVGVTFWVVVSLLATLILFEISLSLNLINQFESGPSTAEALKLSTTWRTISIFRIVRDIMGFLVIAQFWFGLIIVLFQLGVICLAECFINEIKANIKHADEKCAMTRAEDNTQMFKSSSGYFSLNLFDVGIFTHKQYENMPYAVLK